MTTDTSPAHAASAARSYADRAAALSSWCASAQVARRCSQTGTVFASAYGPPMIAAPDGAAESERGPAGGLLHTATPFGSEGRRALFRCGLHTARGGPAGELEEAVTAGFGRARLELPADTPP